MLKLGRISIPKLKNEVLANTIGINRENNINIAINL
jgi:hypothetical protein